MKLIIKWLERGYIPDTTVRFLIRILLKARLKKEYNASSQNLEHQLIAFRNKMEKEPIAHSVDSANSQHYEVPVLLFENFMGKYLKYSCGYWRDGKEELDKSEEEMLKITCERAQIKDGQQILELGCGWGSLSIWMAKKYPKSNITAVSNSNSQKLFIDSKQIPNLKVVTADMNSFSTEMKFDRVISVEMFEHMRNWHKLLKNISEWLTEEGQLFIHIFVHKELAYLFDGKSSKDWMTKYFFKDGMMPAELLLPLCNNNMITDQIWKVNGKHYAKTLRAWLKKIDLNKNTAIKVLANDHGARDGKIQWRRWRIFFMACEELFRFKGGNEWYVCHYRLIKR